MLLPHVTLSITILLVDHFYFHVCFVLIPKYDFFAFTYSIGRAIRCGFMVSLVYMIFFVADRLFTLLAIHRHYLTTATPLHDTPMLHPPSLFIISTEAHTNAKLHLRQRSKAAVLMAIASKTMTKNALKDPRIRAANWVIL